MNQIDHYPLEWPLAYKRKEKRIDSKFDQSPEKAQSFLRAEATRMGLKNLIISCNVPQKKDGYLWSDQCNAILKDPGVAIYFEYAGELKSMCCDTYKRVWENIYAIGKSIENLRAIDRYGVSDFLANAFMGFKQIPANVNGTKWWEILGLAQDATIEEIKVAYKTLAKTKHPDKGGNLDEWNDLVAAYEIALNQKLDQ